MRKIAGKRAVVGWCLSPLCRVRIFTHQIVRSMIDITDFISDVDTGVFQSGTKSPWEIVNGLQDVIANIQSSLGADYIFQNEAAIHQTAVVEQGVVLRGSIIIGPHCFIGAHAYLRGPIFLGRAVTIGPGSEIKQSIILDRSATAHFNYIGNSIIGQQVNFEAGSICANHYNERKEKSIFVHHNGQTIPTHTEKFGALVGDHSKIGANAVLSPGTLLQKGSIVKRLELVEQVK
jgi:UDP-N-acetylglucosamine diphosphorylase / glucose-1-phosphate thymidylyltransferase / UDP-N-acetylgalactosamine diphosphorylase / glucosamine-1-phosphate N-acetyltransferase / galactosamine-1-phosphate N-acetyltransferase